MYTNICIHLTNHIVIIVVIDQSLTYALALGTQCVTSTQDIGHCMPI